LVRITEAAIIGEIWLWQEAQVACRSNFGCCLSSTAIALPMESRSACLSAAPEAVGKAASSAAAAIRGRTKRITWLLWPRAWGQGRGGRFGRTSTAYGRERPAHWDRPRRPTAGAAFRPAD